MARPAPRYDGDAIRKVDANDGRAGDNPYFQRHNVARAWRTAGGYWYTSKHRLDEEPYLAGAQWVDYKPPFAALG